MDLSWQNVALVVSALAFGAFTLYRVRPVIDGKRQSLRVVLKDVRSRIDGAKDDAERALALCDAGDACAAAVGRGGAAMQFYLRAMRQQPSSLPVAERAIAGLAKRPRAAEKVLLRRLGRTAWTEEHRPVVRACLRELGRLYSGPLRDKVRAAVYEQALDAYDATNGDASGSVKPRAQVLQ